MNNFKNLFEGKKITLMGLGLLGRGVGDAEFLAQQGAQITVTDKKTEAELEESVNTLKQYKNITFKLGGHDLADFTNADMVVKAAGVSLNSPEIAAARAAGVEVVMSTALFGKYARDMGAKIVGVTGTRGKTTIVQMIAHSLIRANRRIVVGGNIRGVSTLALLPNITADTIAVLELDSWQLQGFGDLKISPDIAVFTNLMPDHLNYYGGSMEKYFEDKANIFKFQKMGGVLIAGASVVDCIRATQPPLDPIVPEMIPKNWKLKLPGQHNRENASLAAAALQALGLSESEIKKSLESFEPVEGRLQFVREVNGVKIYNDNNSTTPEATIAALRALDGNITLIVGGSEKNLPLDELVSEIKKRVSHVILLVHPNYLGSTRLAKELKQKGVEFEEAVDLESAVASAVNGGDVLLFSPALASFGMFNNEYDRNDKFLAVLKTI